MLMNWLKCEKAQFSQSTIDKYRYCIRDFASAVLKSSYMSLRPSDGMCYERIEFELKTGYAFGRFRRFHPETLKAKSFGSAVLSDQRYVLSLVVYCVSQVVWDSAELRDVFHVFVTSETLRRKHIPTSPLQITDHIFQ